MNQVIETAASLTQYLLIRSQYGILTCFIEFCLYASGYQNVNTTTSGWGTKMADLLHLDPEVKQEQGRDHTQTESDPPYRIQVVETEDPETDQADEIGNDKGKVEHGVCGQDEKALLASLADYEGVSL